MTKKYWGARGKQGGESRWICTYTDSFLQHKRIAFLFFTAFVYNSGC